MTDDTDTYDFATFDKEATNGEPPYPVIEINRKGLAHFINEDQTNLLSIIAMALVVMAFPTNKFQPKTVWEHYCKYTLHIHPSQATEDQYDYFLDCWSGDDEYQYLYDYYEKKYPEYNQELKHYGK